VKRIFGSESVRHWDRIRSGDAAAEAVGTIITSARFPNGVATSGDVDLVMPRST
jgi:hypothetical protein